LLCSTLKKKKKQTFEESKKTPLYSSFRNKLNLLIKELTINLTLSYRIIPKLTWKLLNYITSKKIINRDINKYLKVDNKIIDVPINLL